MPKGQRFCIYCGGAGLSKEHIYADWLRAYIPRELKRHGISVGVIDASGTRSSTQWRQGDVHARKVRRVCENCNTGWMSRLQESAKPFLVPMINDDLVTLGSHAQGILAAWIAMSAMTAEYIVEEDMVGASQEERDHLRLYQTAPDCWRIWVARYRPSRALSPWIHNAMALAEENFRGPGLHKPAPPNTQTTSICIGKHLFVYAMSSQVPGAQNIIRRWDFPAPIKPFIRQVWPVVTNSLVWPTRVALSGQVASVVANEFFRRTEREFYKQIGSR